MDGAREMIMCNCGHAGGQACFCGLARREDAIRTIEQEVPRLLAIERTARALVDDVRRRYPGEPLRCPLMRQLDEACRG